MGSARRSGGQGHLLVCELSRGAGLCTEVWEFHLGAQRCLPQPFSWGRVQGTPCSPLAVQHRKGTKPSSRIRSLGLEGAAWGGGSGLCSPHPRSPRGPCLPCCTLTHPRRSLGSGKGLQVWGERMEGGAGGGRERRVGAGPRVPTRGEAPPPGDQRAGRGWRPSPGQQRDWVARRRSILPASPRPPVLPPLPCVTSLCFAFYPRLLSAGPVRPPRATRRQTMRCPGPRLLETSWAFSSPHHLPQPAHLNKFCDNQIR